MPVYKESPSEWIIGDKDVALRNSLAGLVMENAEVGMLDIGNVIVQTNYLTNSNVAIVSGGYAGFEPLHVGFVGRGMLTAAIQGHIYSSPCPTIILESLRALSAVNRTGIMLLVRNNSSNRLCFGLGMERAIAEGICVRMVALTDNLNPSIGRIQGRTGLSGVVLVLKVAGAMSEDRLDIGTIQKACEELNQNMGTMTVGVRTIYDDFQPVSADVEFGVGLLGEAGFRRDAYTNLPNLVKTLVQEMAAPSNPNQFRLEQSTPLVVLVNNLGRMNRFEEQAFFYEVMTYLIDAGYTVVRAYSGVFLSSPSITGYALTLLNVHDLKVLKYLDAECTPKAWTATKTVQTIKRFAALSPVQHERKPEAAGGVVFTNRTANVFELVLIFVCDALISCEKQLNVMDSGTGDGDTGSNLLRGAMAIRQLLVEQAVDINNPGSSLTAIAKVTEREMGVLGVLYSVFLEAGARVFTHSPIPEISPVLWMNAFLEGVDAIRRYGNVELGDRTMFDPLVSAAIAFEKGLTGGRGPVACLEAAAVAAEESACWTRLPAEKYADPGAHAVAVWMRAVSEAVKLRCEDPPPECTESQSFQPSY